MVEVEERIIKVNEIEIGERIKFKLYLGKYCYKKKLKMECYVFQVNTDVIKVLKFEISRV